MEESSLLSYACSNLRYFFQAAQAEPVIRYRDFLAATIYSSRNRDSKRDGRLWCGPILYPTMGNLRYAWIDQSSSRRERDGLAVEL